jgi:hypothetical protein
MPLSAVHQFEGKIVMNAAHITLKLTAPSIANYKVFGFAARSCNGKFLELSNVEGEIVMTVPYERVESLTIEF